MLVGIHVDPHKGFTKLLERYEKILDFNNISHIRLDSNDSDFWEKVKKLDLFIFNWYGTERQYQMAHAILPIVEDLFGVPCYPSKLMNWLYDDKVREYYFLKQHSIPVIPTWIFWNKSNASDWLETVELPIVFKLRSGASDENVILAKSKSHGKRLINKMFGSGIVSGKIPGFDKHKLIDIVSREQLMRIGGQIKRKFLGEKGNHFVWRHRGYVLFQKFLPNNMFDTRIAIIGNRAFGDVRYVMGDDFRASGSWNYSCDPKNIDQRCIKIAFEVSKKFKFSSMMYDFLFDENRNPLICEISYTQPDWRFWMYAGYWDEQMNWHEGHHWPQYLVLMDMLKIPDLKQPEMRPTVGSRFYPIPF